MNRTLVIFILLTFSLIGIKNSYSQNNISADSANIAWHISVLAHDSMQGRNAGTKEEAIAAGYIATQFELFGLKPYKKVSNSYIIPYEYGNVNYRKCIFNVNGTELKHGKEFGAIASSANGRVKGQLVPEKDFLQSANSNSNQIPIVNLFQISGRNTANAQSTALLLVNYINAGAKAIVLYNSAGLDKRLQLFNPDSIPLQAIPIIYIDRKTAMKLLKADNQQVEINVEVKRNPVKTANVAGFVDNGSAKTVVIGAHYDHVGYNGRGNEKGICNGADDNASGTAAMLELARWVASRNDLKYNYLFIAFSAEEQGLIGSKHWCNLPEIKNNDFFWMLNLDMVGRLNWNGKNDLTVLAYASAKEWKTILPGIEQNSFDVHFHKGAPPFSDHAPFLENSIPVVYLTTGLPPEYHKPSDDTETINFAGEASVLQYMRDIVLEIEKTETLTFKKITGWQNAVTASRVFLFN